MSTTRKRTQAAARPTPQQQIALTVPVDPADELRSIVAPLAASAVQTSVAVYRWGLANRRLLQAGVVMDIAGNVTKELSALLGDMNRPTLTAQATAK